MILKQMRELGMKQRVFGSHRTIGDELVKLAGPAADGFEAVFPYDPTAVTHAGWNSMITMRRATTKSQISSLRLPTMRCVFCSTPFAAQA